MADDARQAATAPGTGVVLALDTGSPVASLAIAAGAARIHRTFPARAASTGLFDTLDEALAAARRSRDDLAAVLVARGPGSFTGLRIGFAAAQGLSQVLGLAAGGCPTLHLLASLVPAAASRPTALALVDALRGEWFAQRYRVAAGPDAAPEPLGEPQRLRDRDLAREEASLWVGYGAGALRQRLLGDAAALEPDPASGLAGALLRLHALGAAPMDPALLLEPLYLREAAATPLAARPAPR